MADLAPLIRFRKHGVDEKRRVLAQLLREAETVERQKKVIEDQMNREIAMAKELGRIDADAYLGKYLQGARKKVKALEMALKKMEGRIEAAQEEIRESFAEMKKIEITQELRDKREDAAQKRKEDNELDDIAIDRFRRNQDET
jgi:flagellar export protein FliJ